MAKNPAMPVLISGTVEQLGFRLCSWECDLIQPLWEIWQCPLKGGTFTTNSPEIPGLGLCQCKCTPVSWDVSKGVHSAWWAHDRKYHYSGYTAVPRHRSVFETQTWYWRENQTHKEILYSSSCLSLPVHAVAAARLEARHAGLVLSLRLGAGWGSGVLHLHACDLCALCIYITLQSK